MQPCVKRNITVLHDSLSASNLPFGAVLDENGKVSTAPTELSSSCDRVFFTHDELSQASSHAWSKRLHGATGRGTSEGFLHPANINTCDSTARSARSNSCSTDFLMNNAQALDTPFQLNKDGTLKHDSSNLRSYLNTIKPGLFPSLSSAQKRSWQLAPCFVKIQGKMKKGTEKRTD